MKEQSFQMINLSIDDLLTLISNCISNQLKNIKEQSHSLPSRKEKEILSIEDVEKLLNLSKTTLWKYRKNGTLPGKKIGSRVYYSRTVLSNFLNTAA